MMDQEAKRALRATALEFRRRLGPAARRAASQAIAATVLDLSQVRQANHVFSYLSMPEEVDTRALIDGLLALDIDLHVPRINADRSMRVVPFTGWDSLIPGPLGILQPPDAVRALPSFDVVLTPGVAFTRTGVRLGFGAGHYDRWFATAAHRWRIGLAFDCQLFPALPRAAHDVLMHGIVTESGYLAIGAPGDQ